MEILLYVMPHMVIVVFTMKIDDAENLFRQKVVVEHND